MRVEIARHPKIFPISQVFHSLWSNDAGLLGRDELVLNTAPANATADQRGKEVHQVQKRNSDCDNDVNPGLRHDLAAGGGKRLGGANDAQSAAHRGEQQGKQPKSNDLGGWARFGQEIQSYKQPKQDCENVEKMSGKGHGPHFGPVDACDFYLAIGEFEEIGKVGLDIGEGEALGEEDDLAAGTFDGRGERVVVAEGVLPDFEHADLIEDRAADGGAATPAKVLVVTAEHGDDGGIPGREEDGGEAVVVRDEPAHGGGGANPGIREGRDHVMEPGFARATIGIGEDQDLELGRELLDADAQVVDLFAAIRGLAGDDDIRFYAGAGGDPLDGGIGGILFRGQDEKDFVVLVIEFAEGDKVALEAGLHAAAGTQDGGARSVETRIGLQTATYVKKPLDSLPEQEDTRSDLENRQKCEESFHAISA